MYKKEVLLTSGCSFTDNWWTEKHNIPVWPELFAKRVDMQCINLGKRGMGNDYILNSIIDKLASKKDKIGLVVVMWSDFTRIDFEIEEDADIYGGLPWIAVSKYSSSDVSSSNIREILTSLDLNGTIIYRKPFRIKELVKKSLRTFYIFQELMESMKLPYMQLVGTRCLSFSYHRDAAKALINSPYLNKINKKNFLGWPIFNEIGGWCIDDYLDKMDGVRIDEKDYHPNKDGHEEIVKLLIDPPPRWPSGWRS